MSKKKVKLAPIFRSLSHDVNSGKMGRYFVIEPESGVRQVLKMMPHNTVIYSTAQGVEDALLKYLASNDLGSSYDLTPSQATQCIRYWMSITDPIELPPNLAEKDDARLCFHRLNFNYCDSPNETPVIDEFLSRCTNANAIRHFIGSLFVENSSPFQYLWIYGAGGEGKGSFGRALMNVMGPGGITMTVPRTDGQKQFLSYSLLGKRLCVFPECSNFSFPADPLFKQFTGGDHIWFEQKGKMGFSGKLNSKFIFFSNEQVAVHGTDANTRRLIYSEVAKPTVKYSSTQYDALLSEEMSNFILKCRCLYIEQHPGGEEIENDDFLTRELIDFNEEKFHYLTQKWLIVGQSCTASPTQMQEIKTQEGLGNTEYRHWIAYLKSKFGIETKLLRDGEKVYRHWRGIKLKPKDFITGRPIVTS